MARARWIVFVGILLVASAFLSRGQAEEAKPAAATKQTVAPTPDQEKAFAELLAGAVLEGTWRMTTFEEGKERELGEARADRYSIEKAEKVLDDNWIITARVEYGDKDVSLPVPVRVVWAGDTPVITVDAKNLPMLGTYSARVMFHNGFYGGVWYGPTYGGVMSGRVVRPEAPKSSPRAEQP